MTKEIFHITLKNLGYVDKIITTKFDLPLDCIGIKPFKISTAMVKDSVLKNISDYIIKLNLKADEIKKDIEFRIDQKLHDALLILDKERENHTADILIRLLGIICGYAFVGPTTLHLDLTNACNTNCIYCWWHSPDSEHKKSKHYKEWFKKTLPIKTVIQFLEDAKKLEALDVLIAGAGEPLLYPEIDEVILTIKRLGFHTHLFTNGIKLDEHIAKLFIDNDIDQISLTFSGTTFDNYKKNYPGITLKDYERILKNIKFFNNYKQKKSEEGKNVKSFIMLCFVVNKFNYKKCTEYISFAHSLGIKDVRFQMMDSTPGTHKYVLDDAELKELKNILKEAREKAKELCIRIDENIDFQEETISGDGTWKPNVEQKNYCFAGWYFTRLWTDQKNISFCCSEKHISNMREKTFKEIWNSEDYRWARMIGKSFNTKSCFRTENNRKLIDKSCMQCGNYEFNERALRFLKETELFKYLEE